jgi:hypothetical protein
MLISRNTDSVINTPFIGFGSAFSFVSKYGDVVTVFRTYLDYIVTLYFYVGMNYIESIVYPGSDIFSTFCSYEGDKILFGNGQSSYDNQVKLYEIQVNYDPNANVYNFVSTVLAEYPKYHMIDGANYDQNGELVTAIRYGYYDGSAQAGDISGSINGDYTQYSDAYNTGGVVFELCDVRVLMYTEYEFGPDRSGVDHVRLYALGELVAELAVTLPIPSGMVGGYSPVSGAYNRKAGKAIFISEYAELNLMIDVKYTMNNNTGKLDASKTITPFKALHLAAAQGCILVNPLHSH